MSKRTPVFFLAALLLFGAFRGNPLSAMGAQTGETSEPMERVAAQRENVVRVESICWDGESRVYQKDSVSGFLVSKGDTGIYAVTVEDSLTPEEEEKEAIRKKYHLEEGARILEKLEVVFQGDLRIGAAVVGESRQRNLTVLKLDQDVNVGSFLTFARENPSQGEPVYLLGYPKEGDGGKTVYDDKHVSVEEGSVLSLYEEDGVPFFRHTIAAREGCAGGPLLDRGGNLIGMLLSSNEEEGGTALSADALGSFLTTLNIGFEQQQEEPKKKPPVLNLVLGAVIAVLAVLVCLEYHKVKKGTGGGTPRAEQPNARKGRKRRRQRADGAGLPKNVRAGLELAGGKGPVPILRTVFVVGKEQGSDLILPGSDGVSRRHAAVLFEHGDFYLVDLRSTNQTRLNGHPIPPGERRALKDGDEITLGRAKLHFRCFPANHL